MNTAMTVTDLQIDRAEWELVVSRLKSEISALKAGLKEAALLQARTDQFLNSALLELKKTRTVPR